MMHQDEQQFGDEFDSLLCPPNLLAWRYEGTDTYQPVAQAEERLSA